MTCRAMFWSCARRFPRTVVRDGSPIFVRRPIGVDFCVRCTSGAKPTDRFWHFCDVAIGRADIQSWGQSGPNI